MDNNTLDGKGFYEYKPYSSLCGKCKYFDRISFSCKAYPVGIPKRYLSGEKMHTKIQGDQVGEIVFTDSK